MNPFKFYINGTEITPPNNFEKFTEDLIRNETKRHVYYDFPISLEFIGDGYDILDTQYKVNYNSQLRFKVTEQTENAVVVLFDAFIKVSNITFDLVRKVAICQIDDVTYQAYIFSNYSVEVGCGAGTSKNGIDITSIQSLGLTVYNPVNGVDEAETRRAFDVKDAMSMLVAYVSDNSLTFESDWYDGLSDNEKLAIVTGFELRNHSGRTAPIVSLEDLFNELWKKFNLYLIIENPINSAVVRLEQESYLYGGPDVDILYCENLSRSMDFERLYSTIKIGSSKFIKERSTAFLFPYLRLFSFCEETYNLEGVINVDNTLELISEYIIDTNVIQDVIVNDNDEYDEEIFLIQYNSTTNAAVKGDYFDTVDPASRLYNETLLNSNVADRFKYLGNLVLQTGEVTSGFRATQTIGENYIRDFNNIGDTEDVVPLQTIFFQDDSTPPNFDLENDYDPVTATFTAQDDGDHVFRARFQINTFGNLSEPPGRPGFDFQIRINAAVNDDNVSPVILNVTQNYASGSVQTFTLGIDSGTNFSDVFTIPVGVETTFIDLVQTRSMIGSDESRIRVRLQATAVSALTCAIGVQNSVFELLASPLSGGTYAETNPDDYYIGIYTANEILVSRDQWEVPRNDVSAQINLSAPDGLKRISYAKKISRKFIDGSTQIETLFNRKQPII
jgi:hypothetical protein